MASDDPMAEIRASFFVECEELMEALQDGLADIENGSSDDETINVVFRAVHSIKGGAAAFGLDDLVAFAHGYETALDVVRKGDALLTPPSTQIAQQCADFLGDLVVAARDDSAADTPRGAALVQELTGALSGGSQSNPTEQSTAGGAQPANAPMPTPVPIAIEIPADANGGVSDRAPAFQPTQIKLPDAQGKATASKSWDIRFTPTSELHQTGNDARKIFRGLAELGDVQATLDTSRIPTLDQFDLDETYVSWSLTLTSACSEERIRDCFTFVDGICDYDVKPAGSENGSKVEHSSSTEKEPLPTVETAKSDASAKKAADPKQSISAPDPAVQKTKQAAPSATVRVELDRIDRLINQVGELVINQAMLSQSAQAAGLPAHSPLLNGLDEFLRLTRDIQDSVMLIRAQPVKPLFQRMARIVRETSLQVGKDVRLVTEGEATEIDKTVVERLAEPLTHMIRNAVDHGLEHGDARLAANKPKTGTITLSAAHRSGRVVLELRDDGAGINRERVQNIAIEKGLISADAQLSPNEIDNLLFLPGFSTVKEVSDLSGRGVGMDVVKTALQDLGGRISITSEPGEGTTFTISLPLTLAVLDGMVISVADETLVLPLSTIQETLMLAAEDLLALGTQSEVIRLRGRFLPVIDLGVELGYRAKCENYADQVALIVQTDDGNEAAIVIDQILEQRQVVIKGMQNSFGRIPGVAAATILGDGRIALILDPVDIIARKRGTKAQETEPLKASA